MGEHYIDCYETGKNLACMHEEQIEQFLHLVPFVAHFFSTEVEQTSISKATLDILKYYPAIDQFLRITKVVDTSSSIEIQNSQKLQCEQDITKFKSNLLNYQKNFYAHALCCYYPQLVNKVWKNHGVGVGVFTLQGFERRNKESKTIAKKYYNGKHNVCTQTLKRNYDFYHFSA